MVGFEFYKNHPNQKHVKVDWQNVIELTLQRVGCYSQRNLCTDQKKSLSHPLWADGLEGRIFLEPHWHIARKRAPLPSIPPEAGAGCKGGSQPSAPFTRHAGALHSTHSLHTVVGLTERHNRTEQLKDGGRAEMPEMTVNQIHSLGFWMSLDLSDTEGDRDIQTDHQIWSRPTRPQDLLNIVKICFLLLCLQIF